MSDLGSTAKEGEVNEMETSKTNFDSDAGQHDQPDAKPEKRSVSFDLDTDDSDTTSRKPKESTPQNRSISFGDVFFLDPAKHPSPELTRSAESGDMSPVSEKSNKTQSSPQKSARKLKPEKHEKTGDLKVTKKSDFVDSSGQSSSFQGAAKKSQSVTNLHSNTTRKKFSSDDIPSIKGDPSANEANKRSRYF